MPLKPTLVNLVIGTLFGVIVLQLTRQIWLSFELTAIYTTDPLGVVSFWQGPVILNSMPFTIFLLIVYCALILFFNLHKRYFWSIILISIGFVSNSVEKIGFGQVLDYIPLGIAIVNLADVCIILGLILLNKNIWISHSKNQDRHDFPQQLKR